MENIFQSTVSHSELEAIIFSSRSRYSEMPIPCDVYAWMVVTAVISVLIYAYLTWTRNYWRKKGVPYLEPELFFGALRDNVFGKKSLGECYQDCYW